VQYYHKVRIVQNGSGAHPTSFPMGTVGSFPAGKAPGRGADHSPPSSAFMAWCSVKAQGQLTRG
jgi:hypothetical protein